LHNNFFLQKGFSLLEAIVALLLVTTLGLGLLSWANNNLLNLTKIEKAYERDDAIKNALDFIEAINLTEYPSGKEQVGHYTFEWSANAIEPAKDVILSAGYPGLYEVTLYLAHISIFINTELIHQFTLHQVGFKQVRERNLSL